MNISRPRQATSPASLMGLPEYIISNFIPGAQPLLQQYPAVFKLLSIIAALWYFFPLTRLQSLWTQFSSLFISSVSVSSDEDLFNYVSSSLLERNTIRADQSLVASSNSPSENRRNRFRQPDFEESNARQDEPKIKYEQSQGLQLFFQRRRVFWVTRAYGEGHTFTGSKYKRTETLTLSCFGRSTQVIKDLLENIYYEAKNKERALTIIRRPYAGGGAGRLSWSRLTSKPRRALDTVILDADQKESVIADVQEYMDESTSAFYGNHGIPYRRGYLFHGPPGVGKTSFALALANKFNLDVYVLTLLDEDLTDSDLISLLNQLPSRSLLLLEDIDTAGLSRKKSMSTRSSRRGKNGRLGTILEKPEKNSESEDESSGRRSRVSLSGLLNAIDGVAAPEGHILIMTTNKPLELDEALVRAGRISVRVSFKTASRTQAEEIFRRMYADLPSATGIDLNGADDEKAREEVLDRLAKDFADKMPEFEFSPADLQDYLLVHKKDPAQAVEELEKWMGEMVEERKRREEEKENERRERKEKKKDERKKLGEELKDLLKDDKEKGDSEKKKDDNAEDEADDADDEHQQDAGKSESQEQEGKQTDEKKEETKDEKASES